MCPICDNLLKRKDSSIHCDLCQEWVHLKKCSSLSLESFDSLSKSDNQWFCSKCINKCLPFNWLTYNDIITDNIGLNMTSDDISIVPSLSYFLEECNSTANNYYDNVHSEEFNEFPNPINLKYYDIGQFNSIKHDPTSSFSLFHTNLASINKHFDDMQNILSCLKTKFDIIGITEHKIKKEHNTPVLNINLDGYHPFIFDTSDTNCGGTGLYIKDSIKGMISSFHLLEILSPHLLELSYLVRKI